MNRRYLQWTVNGVGCAVLAAVLGFSITQWQWWAVTFTVNTLASIRWAE